MLTSTSNNTADQVSGVDYYLQASTSGIFTISSRNTLTSTPASDFPDTYIPDASAAGETLSPHTADDLGGATSTAATIKSNGTFQVADYVLSVSPTAPFGNYTITAFTVAGTGYEGPGPVFMDTPFSSIGSFTVTVTPEPASLGLLGLGSLSLLARRRRIA